MCCCGGAMRPRACSVGKGLEVAMRLRFFAVQLCLAQRARKPCISRGTRGKDQQVSAGRVRHTARALCIPIEFGQVECDFGPEYRSQTRVAGCQGKAHCTVEAVVIGKGQPSKLKAYCLIHQLFWMARPIKK